MDYSAIANILKKEYPKEAEYVRSTSSITGRTLLLLDLIDPEIGEKYRIEYTIKKLINKECKMNKINGYDKVEWGTLFDDVVKIYGSMKKGHEDNGLISYVQYDPEKFIEERTFKFLNDKLQAVCLTVSDYTKIRESFGIYDKKIVYDVIERMNNEFGNFNEGKIKPNFRYKKLSNTKFIKERTGAIYSTKDYYKKISDDLKIEMCIIYQDKYDDEIYSNSEEILDEKYFTPEMLLIEYINPKMEKKEYFKNKDIEKNEDEKRLAEINKISL